MLPSNHKPLVDREAFQVPVAATSLGLCGRRPSRFPLRKRLKEGHPSKPGPPFILLPSLNVYFEGSNGHWLGLSSIMICPGLIQCALLSSIQTELLRCQEQK